MLIAVVNYAQPITRWRHTAHDKKMVLNKLLLLHDFRLLSLPILLLLPGIKHCSSF